MCKCFQMFGNDCKNISKYKNNQKLKYTIGKLLEDLGNQRPLTFALILTISFMLLCISL